jgi:hypothetical protein
MRNSSSPKNICRYNYTGMGNPEYTEKNRITPKEKKKTFEELLIFDYIFVGGIKKAEVKKPRLFRWKKTFTEAGGNPVG